MARLEISICQDALIKYRPHQVSVKTLFHLKMQAALCIIIDEVLNDSHAKAFTYRKTSIPTLIGKLGHCDFNLLAIGKRHSWIINASTAHDRHFVGTRHAIGLTTKASNQD